MAEFDKGNKLEFPDIGDSEFFSGYLQGGVAAGHQSEASKGVRQVRVLRYQGNSNVPTIFNLQWIPWIDNGINYYEGTDAVISGNFTGCYMSCYSYRGNRRVAHINTHSSEQKDCVLEFKRLIALPYYEENKYYKPYKDFGLGPVMFQEMSNCPPAYNLNQYVSTIAIMTNTDDCYAYGVKKVSNDRFEVFFKSIVQPTNLRRR